MRWIEEEEEDNEKEQSSLRVLILDMSGNMAFDYCMNYVLQSMFEQHIRAYLLKSYLFEILSCERH